MTKRNQAVGAYGERCAVRHLIEAGLRPVARNWRCPDGEIDLIAWEGAVLAFCEVKTRRTEDFGTSAEAIVPAKARRLRGLAARWLAETGTTADELRFDILAVRLSAAGPARHDTALHEARDRVRAAIVNSG
ncbi:YraN family protein [Micromonospora sp. SL1-18]|uniref:YraN family protein n=1 Tax=Micromonospora sp. SL1-18 TaxID=3399128 RepID=UPI003A4D4696